MVEKLTQQTNPELRALFAAALLQPAKLLPLGADYRPPAGRGVPPPHLL